MIFYKDNFSVSHYRVRCLVGYLFSVRVYIHNFRLAESVDCSNCKNI